MSISVNATVDQVLKWMIDLFAMNIPTWVVALVVIMLYAFGYGYALQQWRINNALRIIRDSLREVREVFYRSGGSNDLDIQTLNKSLTLENWYIAFGWKDFCGDKPKLFRPVTWFRARII